MANLLYTDLAQYYELIIVRDYKKEAKYLNSVIECYSPLSTSLIDLGCGIGMHLKYLSGFGFDTTGLDNSEKMLAQSFRNSPKSEFIKAGFKNFSLPEKKDVAICMGTSFTYLLTDEDFISFIDSIHSSINELLVLDTRNFLNPNNIKKIENDHLFYENDKVKFNSIMGVTFRDGFRIMNFHHKILNKESGKSEEFYDQSVSRLFTLDMINGLLSSKFNLIAAHGDYDINVGFNVKSKRLLAVYKKI